MPETTVNEDNLLQRWKDDVRMPRQASTMETVAITQSKEKTSNLKFWRHILAANMPHVPAAAFRRYGIDHDS